ncbi:MAG: hypothetical protein ACK4FW_11180, partial [Stenotrophomonas sp.]
MPAHALLFGYALAALATAGANVGLPPPAGPQRVDALQAMAIPCLSVRVSSGVSVAVSEQLLQHYVAARRTGPGPRVRVGSMTRLDPAPARQDPSGWDARANQAAQSVTALFGRRLLFLP